MDVESVDQVLKTTRSVRRKLDFERQVPLAVIEECIYIATQAPVSLGGENWRFIVVSEASVKSALADLYSEVLIDLSEQTTTAMVGDEVYHTAYGTTGKDGWETPIGEFSIIYRVENETMTSASIGAEEYYVLENVLYTQYFTTEGHALHLNYWRPDSVFGNERTSHGCIGLRYADAEFFWRFAGYGTRVVIQA